MGFAVPMEQHGCASVVPRGQEGEKPRIDDRIEATKEPARTRRLRGPAGVGVTARVPPELRDRGPEKGISRPSVPPVAKPECSEQGDPVLEWARGFADPRWSASPHGLEEQQITTGPEHPAELGQDTLLRRIAIVVKHRNRDHDVECPGIVGNLVLHEPADVGGGPTALREGHHTIDQIDAAILAAPPLEERHPAPGAAAVVEESAAAQREQGIELVECGSEDAVLDAVNARVFDRSVQAGSPERVAPAS